MHDLDLKLILRYFPLRITADGSNLAIYWLFMNTEPVHLAILLSPAFLDDRSCRRELDQLLR